jgi:hypothetical protein
MNVSILRRSIARIDRPTVRTGMTPQHRVRPLVPSGDTREAGSNAPALTNANVCAPRGWETASWMAAAEDILHPGGIVFIECGHAQHFFLATA